MPDIISGGVVDVYPFCILDGRPRYLTLLRTPGRELGNTWQTIHGLIGKKETSVQAAARELLTQAGLRPTALFNIDYVNTFYSPDEDVVYVVPSIAALVPAEAEVELTPDHVHWEWVSVEHAVRRLLWAGERFALQTLHEDIAAPMAAGQSPHPYLQISPALYLPAMRRDRR